MSNRTLGLFAVLALISGALLIPGCMDRHRTASVGGSGGGAQYGNQPRSTNELVKPSVKGSWSQAQSSRRRPDPRDSAPSGSLPSLDEEVWIIARHDKPKAQQARKSDDVPGTGVMMTRRETDGQQKNIALPLQRTDVAGDVQGYISSVNVSQRFYNPYDGKIEAVYVFPLPQNAAVNEFVMTIGERKIRGIIRKKNEAKRLYKQAKQQGYQASLLTQQRPNVFTQQVANLEPGKRIDVDIRYFNTLSYRDGWYEFTFPMVVGPRFNPPNHDDPIGAVPRGSARSNSKGTDVSYLAPGESSAHRVHLNLDIRAGVPIEEVVCTSHPRQASISNPDNEHATVRLPESGIKPNKDFTVRWRVAGKQLKANLITHRPDDAESGYFALTLYPPKELAELRRQPLEMVFVLDTSGSMSGKPLAQAKDAVDHALGQLTPRDTFQVIRFSDDASTFGSAPVRATDGNIDDARDYVDDLSGGGGTMMMRGLNTALDFKHDPERLRFVCFLTDGYIGNEKQILGTLHKKLGATRVFSFGVGESPNRYLMNRMAKLGRGAVAYLPLEADASDVMDQFYQRVRHPALTNLAIDWDQWQVEGTHPRRIPDLFVGRAVTVTGRMRADRSVGGNVIRIDGSAGGRQLQINVKPEAQTAAQAAGALPAVWARRQIADLYDRATYTNGHELPQQIQRVALNHSLMSAYTAFIAVDSSRRTAGEHGTTVHQAVPVPAGVKYETAVPGE